MPIPPHRSSFSKRQRGSAIIGALVMISVMALAVGTMLSTSNSAIKRSTDKITYEEGYQTALAGTHIARAWLIDPKLAGTMAGNGAGTIETDLKDLINKAIVMNDQIKTDVVNKKFTNMYGPSSRYTAAGINLGATASGGRQIVYTFKGSPVVSLDNRAGAPKFATNPFKATPSGGHKTYVEWVRLTTPGTDIETSSSLRACTFIIEAKAVSEYANVKKERVVQQRILIKPNEPAKPLLSATESIITDGTFSAKSMSSGNVHWGPVLAKVNIVNPFFNAISKKGTKGNGKGNSATFNGWEFTLNQAQKANIAGLALGESGNNKFDAGPDTRLHWKAGTAGKIYAGQQGEEYMFDGVPTAPNVNQNREFDFFRELFAGNLNTGATPLNLANFSLDSKFSASGTSLSNSNPALGNGLYTKLPDGSYTGALVQGSPAVDERIDDFFSSMSYDTLKAYALAHNGYYTWDGTTLRNAAGNTTTMPSMSPGNSDTLASDATPDRMLFVDSQARTEATPFTKAIQLPEFWKGVVYANGPIATSGAGSSPNIKLRSPEEFAQYRATGTSATHMADGVFVDGIVICNGTADLGANGAIYGTLAAKKGVITGANFSVFYNSANGEGRLKDTSTGAQPYSLIAGRLYEVVASGVTQ